MAALASYSALDKAEALTATQAIVLLGGAGNVPSGPLWTPLQLNVNTPGLLTAWWDAQDTAHITLSGSNVSGWADKVSAISLTQANSANKPGYSATARNGKPGLLFGPGALFLAGSAASLPLGSPARTLISAGFNNATANNYIFDYGTNSPGAHVGISAAATTQLVELYTGVGSTTYPASEAWTADRLAILAIAAGGTSANWFIDGNSAEPITISAINTTATGTAMGAFINTSTAFWNGVIQQTLVCSGVLSASQLAKVAGWESWYDGKAGSNLPASSPYRFRPPYVSDP